MKKVCVLYGLLTLFLSGMSFAQNVYINNVEYNGYKYDKDDKYEYIYMNPPKRGIEVAGRYIILNSGVRYVHSPSKHKRAAHATRINAYNYALGNY